MVPVAVALAGSHFRLPTVLYVGWFGPRALASIVFALLLLHEGRTAAATRGACVALPGGCRVGLPGAPAGWAAPTYPGWHARGAVATPSLREGPAEPLPAAPGGEAPAPEGTAAGPRG